jgi:subtilase family serine protease
VIRKLLYLCLIVAIVNGAAIVSQAQPKTLLTRHQRPETLAGRTPEIGRLPANQVMRLQLILQHRNQAGLEQFLREQQDPTSANYHKTLTLEQFTEQYGPSREDYEAVKTFARENGLTILSGSRNRMLLQVRGTVDNVEKALNVHMSVYQHDTEGRTFFAPDREPTPNVNVQLWHVGGLDNYSTPKRMLQKLDTNAAAGARGNATIGSGPSQSFLGSDMRAAYYSAEGGTLTGTGQYLGLFELLGTDLTDLDTYFSNVGQTNNVPITLTSVDTQSTSCIDNSKGGFCDDTEQTLDMTQAIGMAPGLTGLTMFIGTGGLSGQSIDDAGIFNAMVTTRPLIAQSSVSWNWKPADNSTDDPFFQEMAAQGQNLFCASGDSENWKIAPYVFPEEDVYVTAVGGTDLDTSSAGGPWSSETAWSDSGGGISPGEFPIPSWQVATAAICSECSQLYRNGPDVSANANFTFYTCADQTACLANEYGGTSFAAPMWAGYMALTNQQYLANGNTTTLGFINPTLYSIGLGSSYTTDFHDITSGCQGGKDDVCAVVGFDLVTGWGSPNGPALLTALAGAPTSGFSLSANPTGVSVVQGNSGTSTITSAVTGGFDGVITLSASGQPTGVTVSFSPTTITGAGTSTATFAVAATTATGVYPITIKGTSGSTTETTTVTLTVTASGGGSFTLAAKPAKGTIAPGGHGNAKVTATPSGGFNQAIALTASGQPTGVKVAFNPSSIAGGSGTAAMQISVSATAKAGTYTITIKGVGGSVTVTTTFTLTIS